MLAETLVTQHSPCILQFLPPWWTLYQIVLIISHFATPTTSLRINTSLVSSGQTLYQAAALASLLQCFTAESSRDSGETQCLEEAEQQQRQVSIFLILLFKLLTQFPFLFISILSLLPFPIFSLLPLHHPFFLFWSILCPPKIKTLSFIAFCFTNGTYFLHSVSHHDIFFWIMHSVSL